MPCTRRNWLATGARFLEAAQIDAPLALDGLGKGLGYLECYRSIDLYVDLLAYRQNNSRYLLAPTFEGEVSTKSGPRGRSISMKLPVVIVLVRSALLVVRVCGHVCK